MSAYLELAKSGIVTLIVISSVSGFLLGSSAVESLDARNFVLSLLGLLLLAAGSSALNQLQERDVDARMPRTARRPLPSGRISPNAALTFVATTILAGTALLWLIAPAIAALGLACAFFYNALYTAWWKRRWAFAAIPGAIPGALPILIGHASASGQVASPQAAFLFALLFAWQMPHFWVIALRYRSDYAAGGFPTLAVTRPPSTTVRHIAAWTFLYAGIALSAPLFGVSPWYWLVAVPATVRLLWELRRYAREPLGERWLRFFLWITFSLLLYLGAAVLLGVAARAL